MNVNEAYTYMIETGLASEEMLQVITSINGYTLETLNSVLFCVTGYRDFEQYMEA